LENRKKGQPLIVLQSGFATPLDHWDRIWEGTTQIGPVLAYDRPGIGKSEATDINPNLKNVADHLLKILDHLEQPPPYILVGHSLGGAYVRGFAHYYPEMLAGLIMIDPADFTETQENKRLYYNVLGWDAQRIDQELATIDERWEKRKNNMPPALVAEGMVLADLRKDDFKEIREKPLPNIPVHILTGGRFDMPANMRSQEYDNEALFRSKMKHRVTRWTEVIQSVDKGMLFYSGDAGHFVHVDDPELLLSSLRIALSDYQKLQEKE
ncbi:MAG: alpha/beta hydrolase, partial [Bacteroidota bacterium]